MALSRLNSKVLAATLAVFVAVAVWSFFPASQSVVLADNPNCPWCNWGPKEKQFDYDGCQNWNLGCWLTQHPDDYTRWECWHWHRYCHYNGERCTNYGKIEGNDCNSVGCCYH